MLCNIVAFDPRFLEYDLDVIAGLNYDISRDGICTRLDVIGCNANVQKYSLFDRDAILRCPLMVIPNSIVDVISGVRNLGEVYADIERVRDFWWWSIDKGMAKLVIQEFYRRLRYLEEMA